MIIQSIKEILKKKIFIHNETTDKSGEKISIKNSKKSGIKTEIKDKQQITGKKIHKNRTNKITTNKNIDHKRIANKNTKDEDKNSNAIKKLTQKTNENSTKMKIQQNHLNNNLSSTIEKMQNHSTSQEIQSIKQNNQQQKTEPTQKKNETNKQQKFNQTAQITQKKQSTQLHQNSQPTQISELNNSIKTTRLKKSRSKSISPETLNELEKKILYSFKNKDLLIDALTHSSLNKMNGLKFERLEFLGDRILNLCIAKMLFLEYPNMNESQMTPKLSHMVCRDMLFEMSEKINLKLYARFKCQNEDRKILADMVEAIIGAIYMDDINHGTQNTEKFIYNYWYETINDELFNPRSELQEILHQHKLANPIYDVYQVNDTFISKITIKADNNFDQENSSYIVASGEGKSIKAANKEAASEAIDQINKILKKK